MIVAVICLAALLVTVAVAVRRTRPATHDSRNVVSLDAYRAARLGGRRSSVPAALSFSSYHPDDQAHRYQYPLSATSGGGLRTVRQPDGRLARPSARPEPA